MSRSKSHFPRVYVSPLTEGEVLLSKEEAHHVRDVLRLRAGDAVELFDGQGGCSSGEVFRADRKGVVVRAAAPRRDPPARLRLHAAFAVPRGKRLDWLLEKAVELGVASLQPVRFARSVAGGEDLTEGKGNRWFAHCVAAAKQCGLNFLPERKNIQPLSEFLSSGGEALRLAGDLGPEAVPMRTAWNPADSPPADVILLVGPEGGFTPAEREDIRRAGYRFVRLGRTTLRTETAVVALLAAARALLE